MSLKNWVIASLNKDNAMSISQKFDLPAFLSILLDIINVSTEKEFQDFFSEDLELFNPFEIKDMDKAVNRILKALNCFEKICVYGDYDADGVTATALLYSYLQASEANVIYYIPERSDEGYGLNMEAVKKLSELGVKLIITVDNGIASIQEVEFAKKLDMDIVITDHHNQHGDEIPKAIAVVDPHRSDCPSKFKDLSGVGLAFKLVSALEGENYNETELLEAYSDLIALGTVADVVPISGENRTLVKVGLKRFKLLNRFGMIELIKAAGLAVNEINSLDIAFFLAPRINAVGRIGSADRAVKLLLSEDEQEAAELAEFVNQQNNFRKEIENEIYMQVKEQLNMRLDSLLDRIIIVDGDDWNSGVIGIVASKITNEYGKPSIIISKSGEEAVASGRSVEGFSLYEALFDSRKFLTKFGGHPMAVGFSIKSTDIDEFKVFINNIARKMSDKMPIMKLNIACKLNISALNLDMVKQIKRLEPFGCSNPKPLFGLYNLTLCKITEVGNGKHLRLEFHKSNNKITAMKFNTTLKGFPFDVGDIVDLAVSLECSNFRSKLSLSVFIRDMRMNGVNYDELFRQKYLYEKIKKNEQVANIIKFIPDRNDFICVYKFIKSFKRPIISADVAVNKLHKYKIEFLKFNIILDIMEELGVIALKRGADLYEIVINKFNNKVDLESSELLINLKSLGSKTENFGGAV